jgi:CDGSH-type Zn-finger protein
MQVLRVPVRAQQARLFSSGGGATGGGRPSGQHGAARVAALAPLKTTLAVDKTHHWCSCGHAGLASGKVTALCDGSHKHVLGAKFVPFKFKIDGLSGPAAEQTKETTTTFKFLCMCKKTATPPMCDGSHTKLPKV